MQEGKRDEELMEVVLVRYKYTRASVKIGEDVEVYVLAYCRLLANGYSSTRAVKLP